MPTSATTLPTCISPASATATDARRLLWATLVGATLLLAGCASAGDRATRDGLVDLQAVVPDIRLDIRYAGTHNFVGTPIRGYDAPKCYLLRPAVESLQRVEADLRAQGLALRVFDCYRPVRAVAHFVRWAHDLDDQRSKPQYYPNLDKRALLGDYIAPSSGHSRGATVDLTLLRCDDDGRCTALDMGTDFDFFDVRANTDSLLVSAQQRRNRGHLRTAMARHGFGNYPLEWWHYTLALDPAPTTAFDVPVR